MGAPPTASTETEIDRLSNANIRRSAAIENWRKIWNLNKLDAVVGPAAQNTAVEHDMYGLPPYTVFLNVLDVSVPLRSAHFWNISQLMFSSILPASFRLAEQMDQPNPSLTFNPVKPELLVSMPSKD